ncbi:MAG: hypothetical protein E7576_13900 [Ruminococcaceae bacterium]|jgi:hypothetical protein|nr:hypothetical protein [Oscillospiraceae bacterium]
MKREKQEIGLQEKTNPLFYILIAALIAVLGWLLADDYLSRARAEEAAGRYLNVMDRMMIPIRARGKEIYEEEAGLIRSEIGSFVLIGDNLALDTPHGSLEGELIKSIDDHLFSELADGLRRVAEVRYPQYLATPMKNGGVTDEGLYEVASRIGARDMVIAEDFVIPGGFDEVLVKLNDEDGTPLRFALQESVRFGEVTISGIVGGFFAADEYYDPLHPMFTYGRYTFGRDVPVSAGEIVTFETMKKYTGAVTVIAFREQEGLSSDKIVELVGDIVDRQRISRYVIVYGQDTDGETADLLEELYPGRFIGCPRKMYAEDYRILVEQIYDCLDAQGCWDVLKSRKDLYLAELEDMIRTKTGFEAVNPPYWK